MADKKVLEHLLSDKYDPADESPMKFSQSYYCLVEHRDELKEKAEAKEERRAEIERSKGQYASSSSSPPPPPPASSSSQIQGSRFSPLALTNNTTPTFSTPPERHIFATELSTPQLTAIKPSKRKDAIQRIIDDIKELEREKEEKKRSSSKQGAKGRDEVVLGVRKAGGESGEEGGDEREGDGRR